MGPSCPHVEITWPSRSIAGVCADRGKRTRWSVLQMIRPVPRRVGEDYTPAVLCRVTLLGGFSVAVDGREITADAWRHRRALELVKILALAPHRRVPAESVSGLLWPELPARAAGANLRKAAHFARATLGAPGAVVLHDGMVSLFPSEHVAVDSDEFERDASTGIERGSAEALEAAVGAYRGELLPQDPYAEWAAVPRERLRALHRECLRGLGRWDRLVEEDPLDEEAHQHVIRMWLERGNRLAAVQAFRRMQDILAAELGVGPGPESMALRRAIRGAGAPERPDESSLIGRGAELELALAAWDAALMGRGGAVLVSGEPGIGKTRLCQELVRCARADGALAVIGAARREEASSPFAAILGTLAGGLREHPELVSLVGAEARERILRPAPGGKGLSGADESTPGVERQRMFSILGRAVIDIAASRGLLLVVDDAHDADDGSLQLLASLGKLAPHHRLLIVVGHRSEPVVPELAALRSTVIERSHAVDLRLQRLPRSAAAQLVTRSAGAAPSESVIESIWRLATGNPFFTVELATSVASDGRIDVPERLYEVIGLRLAGLERAVHRALERVSVAGGRMSATELVAVLGLDERAASALVEQAIAVGVMEEDDEGFRFRHELVRRAIEHSLPGHRRRDLHAEAAARLAAIDADPARIAFHLIEAGRPTEAVPWLEKAALRAAALGAYGDGLRLATDAAARTTAPEARARLLALRADMLYVTGNPAAAFAYDIAIAMADDESRPRLSIMRARAKLATGDIVGAEQSIESAGALSDHDRMSALVGRGLIAWARGDIDAAEDAALGARELAISCGHAAGLAEATELIGLVAHSRGQWRDRVRYELAEALRRSEDVPGSVFDAHLCLAEYLLYGQQPYDEVIEFAADMRSTAARGGAGRGEAFAACLLGEALLLTGRVEEAEVQLLQAARLHDLVGAPAGQSLSLQRLAEASLASGDTARTLELLGEAERLATGTMLESHLLGKIFGTLVQAGSTPEEAMATVERAESVLSDRAVCEPCAMGFFVAASIAAARSRLHGRAEEYVRRAERIAQHWPGGGWHAATLEARAVLAACSGRTAEASPLFARAGELFERAGQPLDARRCVRAST